MLTSHTTIALVAALADPEQRGEASTALARALYADHLLVFVLDPEIGIALPAPGFAQTLADARRWRGFVSECLQVGTTTGELGFPTIDTLCSVRGIGTPDGTVLAVLGGSPRVDELLTLRDVLPLLGAALRGEQRAVVAAGHSVATNREVAEARALATALDLARAKLEMALENAEAANRAKDVFLATVSHELRTPLNAMVGWTRLLRLSAGDEAIFSRGLDTIDRAVEAQTRLIEDILDVSRIVSGQLRLNVRPLVLVSVVERAIDVVQPSAEAKGIRLETVLDPKAGPVTGDPDRLLQIVWNLLSNAIKFTPKGGRVQVRLERVNSHVELTVSDTGRGIAPSFLPHVFERFRQEEGAQTTRKYSGLGLGLALVRHLVELHGGTVEATSPGEALGSTFVVMLPVTIVHAIPAGERSHPSIGEGRGIAEAPSLAGLRVLVVDDNPDALELVSTVLGMRDVTVRTARSAEAGLEIIREWCPDVMISDLGMPVHDGFWLIRQVRELPADCGGRTPSVAVTAFARPEDRTRVLLAGFQQHVVKPVEPDELCAVVASLAGRT